MNEHFVPTSGVHILHRGDHEWDDVAKSILENYGVLCRRDISPLYLKDILTRGPHVADTIMYTKDRRGVTGFTALSWKDGYVETLAICSDPHRGSAKPLMVNTFRLARQKQLPYARLHAMPKVMTYYPKYTYKFVRPMVSPTVGYIHGHDMYKNLADPSENLAGFSNKSVRVPSETDSRKRKLPAKYRDVSPTSSSTSATTHKKEKRHRSPTTPTSVLIPETGMAPVVWVRLDGYPWWPAQVVVPQPRAGQYKNANARRLPGDDVFVAFFGGGYAWTKYSKMCDYRECYDKYAANPKQQALKDAIAEADAALQK